MELDLGETKESHRINKTKILEKLLNSMIEQTETEGLETNDIEKLSNDVKDPDEATKLINRIDKMISIKKNNTLTIARKQVRYLKSLRLVLSL